MTPTHQHLLTQLRDLHEQMGEVLQQMEQAEQTPDRPNLKPGDEAPAIEWLKMMDEPERSEALKWAKSPKTKASPDAIVTCVYHAFCMAIRWANTWKEKYCESIYNKYQCANR